MIDIVDGDFSEKTARNLVPALFGHGADAEKVTDILVGLVGVGNRDLKAVQQLAVKYGGFDEKKLKLLISMLEKLAKKLGRLGKVVKPKKKVAFHENEEISANKLFVQFDKDRSNAIEFDEFYEVIKLMNYPRQVRETVAMDLFVRADKNDSGSLDLSQFESTFKCFFDFILSLFYFLLHGLLSHLFGLNICAAAVKIAQDMQSESVLVRLKLSPAKAAGVVISLLLFISVLFGFIFAGIGAFATPGGFSASVNSLFPVAAGGGASKGSTDPSEVEKNDAGIEGELDAVVEEETTED